MVISMVISQLRRASEGCSKPQSTMARSNSGFNRKSLKPDLGRSTGQIWDGPKWLAATKPGEAGDGHSATPTLYFYVFSEKS